MRIATGILGLILGLLVLLQSCAVTTGSAFLEDDATSEAGAIGLFIGLLYFVGGAFAFGLPGVSVIVFGFAGLLGFAAAAQGEFTDLAVWAGAAIILATMAFFSRKKTKRSPGGQESEHAQS